MKLLLTLSLALSLSVALAACPKSSSDAAPNATAAPAAPGTLVVGKPASAARTKAHVSATDGAITADDGEDGVVQVRVTGAVKGMALVSVNDAGAPEGGQQWDTYVADAKIPPGAGSYATGGETWQLGVFEGAQLKNAADGSLALPAGDHALTLYYRTTVNVGDKLRLAVQRPDGTLQWSDVFPAG
jgi:hypothetical protein